MPLPTSERGPAPKPKPAPRRAPSGGSRFDSNAVDEARTLLQHALNPGAGTPDAPVNPVYNPDTYGALPLGTSEVYDPDTYGMLSTKVNEDQVVKAQTMLEDALRAQREAAIGNGEQALDKPINKQVDRMTYAEYEALPPLQRAAVDFNGLLVQAVRKDRHNQDQYKPTDQQREVYDLSVEKIFGDDGGSTMYAPETLGLLRQIDFQDEAADLDDFLGLKAAIQEKDLAGLERSSTPPAVTGGVAEDSKMSDVDFDQVALERNLAESTQSLQTALVQGNQLLQSLGAMARVERNNDVTRNLGGIQNNVRTALGYGQANWVQTADGRSVPGDLNTYFQQQFDRLSDKTTDRDGLFTAMNADLSGEEFQAFLQYADQRAAQAQQYGLELGQTEGVKYRTPEEFRALLNGKEKPDA